MHPQVVGIKRLLPKLSSIFIGRHKTRSHPSCLFDYKAVLSKIEIGEFPKDPLSSLPPYLLHNILLFIEELKCILLCKSINKVLFKVFDEVFWQKMCLQSFFICTKIKDTWKETFTNVPPATNMDIVNTYELINGITGSRFGRVLEVRNKETRDIYGMKIFKTDSTKIDKESPMFYKYHPKKLEERRKNGKLYVVVDFIEGYLGKNDFHSNQSQFSKQTVQFVAAQVILVAEFMHSKGDLFKCSSIDKIRITDTGYVKFNWISKEIIGIPLSHRISIIDAFEYSAPEFVEGGQFRLSCVFWGLGCLIYQLISGQPLLQNTATNLIKLAREIVTLQLTFSHLFDADSKDILCQLLEKDPTKRLTRFDLLKNHPFFERMDWHALFNMQITPPEELVLSKPPKDHGDADDGGELDPPVFLVDTN